MYQIRVLLSVVWVFIIVKRPHEHSNSYKENISFEYLAYSFRGSAHYRHDRDQGAAKEDVALELTESYMLWNNLSVHCEDVLLSLLIKR